MNRIDNYERMYLGENLKMPNAASRIDALWQAILNKGTWPFEPVTRVEKYLAKMIDNTIEVPSPTTRLEEILNAICNGEKVDAETKNACKDEYLKYIYELKSGENMFVPNNKPTKNGISYNGRTITLNGSVEGAWSAQIYKNLPITQGETVTLRYKYRSGKLTSDATRSVVLAPYLSSWATPSQIVLNTADYMQDKVVVTTIENVPTYFTIYINEGQNTTFDNLTFEVSFEKGDTTK